MTSTIGSFDDKFRFVSTEHWQTLELSTIEFRLSIIILLDIANVCNFYIIIVRIFIESVDLSHEILVFVFLFFSASKRPEFAMIYLLLIFFWIFEGQT